MALPTGPENVCFDATALMKYNDLEQLDLLRKWFPGCAFTPAVVKNEEAVADLDKYPHGKRIQDADWLQHVVVDAPEDVQLVATLRALWKSEDKRDRGEAEVVALCRRYGWTAVMDDTQGRDGARQYGVNCVYMVSMLIATAALGIPDALGRPGAWELHQQVEADRPKWAMPTEDEYRKAFMTTAKGFRRLWQQEGEPPWPTILADGRLDALVERVAGRV